MSDRSGDWLLQIIVNQMNLGSNDVWFENQEINIQNRGNLFVTLGLVSSRSYGNNRENQDISSNYNEVLSTAMIEKWRINICSKNYDALYRKEEILFALRSTFAVSLMETKGFRIASVPNEFLNLSNLEGGSILSRYYIEIEIFTGYTAKKVVDFYDSLGDLSLITEN